MVHVEFGVGISKMSAVTMETENKCQNALKTSGFVNNFDMLELDINKFLHNIVILYIQVLIDFDNHWNYSVTMDTGSNISKISKCSKIDET